MLPGVPPASLSTENQIAVVNVSTPRSLTRKRKATSFDEPIGIAFASNEKVYVASNNKTQLSVITNRDRRNADSVNSNCKWSLSIYFFIRGFEEPATFFEKSVRSGFLITNGCAGAKPEFATEDTRRDIVLNCMHELT